MKNFTEFINEGVEYEEDDELTFKKDKNFTVIFEDDDGMLNANILFKGLYLGEIIDVNSNKQYAGVYGDEKDYLKFFNYILDKSR